MWYTESIGADDDLRVLALGGLLRSEPQKVVPMLGRIALESENPNSAISAVFVLASSSLPEARAAVVKVARQAPEAVQVAAVRDLGRFGGPEVSKDLMSVYFTAQPPVKVQIVKSLGERSEKDVKIRSRAFISLGQAGGAAQLAAMYRAASPADKRAIIGGLGLARADAELIRIAEAERTPAAATLRNEALEQLRLLGTPRARDYLQKVNESR
jgi:HEAT repeat protein